MVECVERRSKLRILIAALGAPYRGSPGAELPEQKLNEAENGTQRLRVDSE